MHFDEDFALALQLREQYGDELQPKSVKNSHTNELLDIKNKENSYKYKSHKEASIVDPTWEYVDPTPDIHALFIQFDNRFFWGKLRTVEVRWSPRMTSCAGVCCYEGRGGLCSVRLSLPLLKLRPRKDLVETLLHEMIHAYLFVTHNDRDRDGHGPEFHKHMYRINKEAGTHISVYHSFHEEVKLYQQHWWRCDGPCQKRPPYYGMVKRAMDRAPGSTDFWWKEHQATCGGHYIKIREPSGFSEKKAKHTNKKGSSTSTRGKDDIRNFFPFHGKGNTLGSNSLNSGSITNKTPNQPSNKPQSSVLTSNSNTITGFKDLFKKNVNSGALHGKEKRNDSSDIVRGTQTINGANTPNSSLFPQSNPKKPIFGNKANTATSGNKDNVRTAGFGGMLANKGGGTLVITSKGNSNSVSNVKKIEGNLNGRNMLTTNFVPFSGKGHTLGAGGETKGTLNGRKSETVASSSVKNSVLLEDSRQSSDNKTLLNGANARKRLGSDVENGESKRIKHGSILDLTTDDGDEYSVSKDNVVKCPVCSSEIGELDVNAHLDSCLNTAFVDDGATAVEDQAVTLEPDSNVKCPACNSEILKCDLHVHLDMCLGSVFGNASVDDDDWEDKTVDMMPKDKVYPCPCCATLVKDNEMNIHLDLCLSGAF